MTDLSKGIIEINGYEVSSATTSAQIAENLKDIYDFCVKSKNGICEIFVFKNIFLLGNHFDIDITFINQKLADIKLISHCNVNSSYEERFTADCEWLKSILGEPSKTGSNGVVYKFADIQIGATNWESDGRSAPDEYISIHF